MYSVHVIFGGNWRGYIKDIKRQAIPVDHHGNILESQKVGL